MVRARTSDHLDALRERFEPLRELAVLEGEGTDYRYRLFVPKATWAEVLRQLALETDYDNFKDCVRRARPGDLPYQSALSDAWATMADLQH